MLTIFALTAAILGQTTSYQPYNSNPDRPTLVAPTPQSPVVPSKVATIEVTETYATVVTETYATPCTPQFVSRKGCGVKAKFKLKFKKRSRCG